MSPENSPVSPYKPVYDAKWRFFWKIGERPEGAPDDFPQCIPKGFEDWQQKMNKWGYLMNNATFTIA
jgi:hypothetical protein